MSFKTIADELFLRYPDGPVYEDLTETEQRRLCAAYVNDDPDIVADLLADIPPLSLAPQFATLILNGTCDPVILAQTVAESVYPNTVLELVVKRELYLRYRVWTRFEAIA